MKRYEGDDGKLTNFHFLVNSDDLKPFLREVDPEKFVETKHKTIKFGYLKTPRKSTPSQLQTKSRRKSTYVPGNTRRESENANLHKIFAMSPSNKTIDESSIDVSENNSIFKSQYFKFLS